MPIDRFLLGLAVGLFCLTSPASAILIETKDGGKVGGFVVPNDDDKLLVIRVPTPDGKETVKTYVRAEIKIVHKLDVDLLGRLSKDNPKAYRDYGEALARQKDDPEARETAMHLYFIAAALAPNKFGASSLEAMSTLASKPAEAHRCKALGFLLDPHADAKLIDAEGAKPAHPDKTQARALADFTKALQHYRAGRIKPAIETAKHDGVDKIFGMTPGPRKIDLNTFLQWCTDANCETCQGKGTIDCPECKGKGQVPNLALKRNVGCTKCDRTGKVPCTECEGRLVRDTLPEDRTRVVLRFELWAMDQQGGNDDSGRKDETDTKSWSAVLQSRRLSPVLPLSLETVIPGFDPRKCRYRNGKWVEE